MGTGITPLRISKFGVYQDSFFAGRRGTYSIHWPTFGVGVHGALHLDLTHNGHAPEVEARYLKTNQFHMQQFTYLVQRLKAINEGGKSLLDSSMLMMASNLYDGDKHGADQMPIVMAGKAGGAMKTGRVLDYSAKGDENRRACSLYLSIMERMGVRSIRFGIGCAKPRTYIGTKPHSLTKNMSIGCARIH